jgi:Na+/H+ antiporter NhaB
MNTKQRQIFYHIREWCIQESQGKKLKLFYICVNGGTGVGKNHLIKCIYNEASKILHHGETPSDTTVLLTAPTGTGAFNMKGFTLDSALSCQKVVQTLSAQSWES